jgi:hypothetical protein
MRHVDEYDVMAFKHPAGGWVFEVWLDDVPAAVSPPGWKADTLAEARSAATVAVQNLIFADAQGRVC